MNFSDLTPVTHLSLEETVYRTLLDSIVTGRFFPGTQVTITELAERLGVSLMPVRQALTRLQAQSLVSMDKSRRIRVAKLSSDDLKELYEIRVNLECMAARYAAKNCGDEMVRALEGFLNEMKTTNDEEVYIRKNEQFHYLIYQTAHKPILFEVIRGLWSRVTPYFHIYYVLGDYRKNIPYHQGMIEGMRERNPKLVVRWLATDLKKAADSLIRQILIDQQVERRIST